MRFFLRWSQIRFRRYFILKIIIFIGIKYCFYRTISSLLIQNNIKSSTIPVTPTSKYVRNKNVELKKIYSDVEYRRIMFERKVSRLTKRVKQLRNVTFEDDNLVLPNYNIHIFYYAWYGNLIYDKNYNHWNHNYLPDWKKTVEKTHTHHDAPLDIGSNFYPELGCYSSRDPSIIQTHMRQLRAAGVGVLVVSWSPPKMKDSPDDILPYLFHYAQEENLKITIHIEPYPKRNPTNLRKHLVVFFDTYNNHPALYKIKVPTKSTPVPVFYVYDSYLTSFHEWKEMLHKFGNITVRGTKFDAIFIGLLVDVTHRFHIKKSNFDGFYTYFAANGFTYGSSWKNWNQLSKFARQNKMMFAPSVGPGYMDTRIRPWNFAHTRHRRNGQYYDFGWRAAIASGAKYISITSFNEWHEGTQIEPAIPKSIPGFVYLDYNPHNSKYYLNLTKWWVREFGKKRNLG